jgi:hypothetical protein
MAVWPSCASWRAHCRAAIVLPTPGGPAEQQQLTRVQAPAEDVVQDVEARRDGPDVALLTRAHPVVELSQDVGGGLDAGASVFGQALNHD